jgi:uncharacterized protein (TIGR02453 family)
MFTDETLRFLRDLQVNNNRDWFAGEKTRYEHEVKAAATVFATEVGAGLQALTGLPHRHKLFRIHRDLRFSRDKTPYNSHIHLSFAPVEATTAPPAWMVGLSPEYFAIGCGIFAFDRAALEAFRARVAEERGAEVARMLESQTTSGARIEPPELKRVPAPYPADHPRGELLRRKGLVVWTDAASPEEGLGAGGVGRALTAAGRLMPVFNLLKVG